MKTAALLAAILFASSAFGYEVKGISPGADVGSVDLKACRSIANADSGVPGYECDTTYAGARATMKLVVSDKRVIAIVVQVANESCVPALKAITEKYGTPLQPNRFIDSFVWRTGPSYLEIEQAASGRGYTVTAMDFDLYHAITKKQTEKAKGDI